MLSFLPSAHATVCKRTLRREALAPLRICNVLLQQCRTEKSTGLMRSVIAERWWYITLYGRAASQPPLDKLWMHPILGVRGSDNAHYVVSGTAEVESPHPLVQSIYLLTWTNPFDWMFLILSLSSLAHAGPLWIISCQGPLTLEARLLGLWIIIVSLSAQAFAFKETSNRHFEEMTKLHTTYFSILLS